MAWSPELVELFRYAKVCITSLPILARYDPSKSTFLKTDWSVEGMVYILMQPTNDEKSIEATTLLIMTSKCVFDTTK